LGSISPWTGFDPSLFSALVGDPMFAGVVEDPAAACGIGDELSVFGDGGVVGLRSQPAASASETATAIVRNFMASPVST
jgi:hypothetical protein